MQGRHTGIWSTHACDQRVVNDPLCGDINFDTYFFHKIDFEMYTYSWYISIKVWTYFMLLLFVNIRITSSGLWISENSNTINTYSIATVHKCLLLPTRHLSSSRLKHPFSWLCHCSRILSQILINFHLNIFSFFWLLSKEGHNIVELVQVEGVTHACNIFVL